MAEVASPATTLMRLQRAHRRCHRCVDAGFLPVARPVFSGGPQQRILLVGQAPGPVESDVHRPFAGRAGRMLMRWFQRAGFDDEAAVRESIYMTSMTTCFPGRLPNAAGDRRPTAREVALCSPWLDSVLELLRPRLILPVGTLAMSRFLPGVRLDEAVGFVFDEHGGALDPCSPAAPALLPLPHPSGQSRWLNDPDRSAKLERALLLLRTILPWAL